ncbi:MAG: HAMP domain-containing protein [Magnetococcales bacterium]|nr:HAMP domain-containing protein [Magnetococcales bacterium]
MSSLRRKIILAYLAVGLLFVGLLLLAHMELRRLENQIKAEEGLLEFFNAVLEMRRYEKNFLLYNNELDIQEHGRWHREAQPYVTERLGRPPNPARMTEWRSLKQKMERYQEAMDQLVAARGGGEADGAVMVHREDQLRQAGKELVAWAEWLAKQEKEQLAAAMAQHRFLLLVIMLFLVLLLWLVGYRLSRAVTRPLKAVEEAMRQVAEGLTSPIDLPYRDQEIRSLTLAFNRMIKELHARQRHLIRAEKLAALGTTLSGVAHELNNPLSNIATSCQILLEDAEAPPFQRRLLEHIDSQTLRAAGIVRSLLDFARDRPFRKEPVQAVTLVEDTLRLLKPHLREGVDLEVRIAPGLTLFADTGKLQQVLLNLIKNAMDAVPEASGRVVVEGESLPAPPDLETPASGRLTLGDVSTFGNRGCVTLRVRDNGTGIDAACLPRLFDPFFTTKEAGKGAGLGLFVTHEIVEKHGGALMVESLPGRGATFHLFLPEEPPRGEP